MLAYAQCMRDNGIDMADPTFDANGEPTGQLFGPESGIDPQADGFQSAQSACGDLLQGVINGRGQGGGLDRDAVQASLNDFTACLRDQGLDVDDLDLNAQGGPGGGPGVGGSLPPDGSIPAGSAPAGGAGQGPGDGDPSNRLAEILGLDPDDPTTAAALEVCAPVLEDAMSSVTSTTVAS